jgi:hypothetical protein
MMSQSLTVKDVITLAKERGKVQRVGDGFTARCPAHEDDCNSLSIGEGRDGKILFRCHAGCTFDQIVNGFGIKSQQVFPPSDETSRTTHSPIEATYDYTNVDGELVYQIVRKVGKKFVQRQPDGNGGWIWKSVPAESRVLYRLPEVVEAISLGKKILIAEGEKDADNLSRLGFPATTNSGGATNWQESYSETLREAHVVIIPDNDKPGKSHAQMVRDSLANVAASVEILEIPGLPIKGDASDWIQNGGTAEQLTALIARLGNLATEEKKASAYLSLTDLLERPELLQPPTEIIHRFAYAGQLTILAAPDKSGKSTLVAHAATQLSRRGYFLSQSVSASTARVVWMGLEEATGHAVRRFQELGAVAENVRLVVRPDTELLEHTKALLTEWPADLLVIDSITEYARVSRGAVPDDGDTGGWSSVIRPLVALTREFPQLSVIALHHTRRSDGQYRSSGEIAAAADCLLEMRLPTDKSTDQNVRHITGRARWTVPAFDVRLDDNRYELAGSVQLSLDTRILLYVENTPGASLSAVRKHIGGRSGTVDAALNELVRRGAIIDTGKNGHHAYHKAAAVPQRPLEFAA